MFKASSLHGRSPQKRDNEDNKRARNRFNLRVMSFVFFVALCTSTLLARFAQDIVLEPEFIYSPVSSIVSTTAAIIPIDLSVNHLQRITLAVGALPEQVSGAPEDFLPIIAEDNPKLRFRLKGSVGASPLAMKDISAYQIRAEHAHNSLAVLWDSGKIHVKSMPRSIAWDGEQLKAGTIVKWRVSVWDSEGIGPSNSDWTKFGVGPTEWKGKWIIHPDDATHFEKKTQFKKKVSMKECNQWKARHPLPVSRARVELSREEQAKEVVSALLVVSGLGSFATSLDGMPLSSSSPLDPAMMDYTKRVSYRGFDVTSHFTGKTKEKSTHVVGITLGSGWWDGRPLTSDIVKFHLLPRGPLTTIAELHLTFRDGSTAVKIPTGTQGWQVAKGFIRESDLFTGETVDLGVLRDMRGWDSPNGWSPIRSSNESGVVWIVPGLYNSDITRNQWRQGLAKAAGAKSDGVEFDFSYAPIGKLVPAEAPPVLPIERIAPESIVDLSDGRWLFDFGKGMSGVLRFEDGLPTPIKLKAAYPRAHFVDTEANEDASFVSVVYADSLEMETGDMNLVLVAGMGLHDGGIRRNATDTQERGGPCFPRDHGMTLAQRDVFINHEKSSGSFSDARQPLFTSHGFRFAEVCCTAAPPTNVYAMAYRSAFAEWGDFDSSNVLLNGAYELTKNALNSNMLGTQTDCPHRERLQYGGDLIADSFAAMHFFDLSGFYRKVIHDWMDTQWDNGGYTETSMFQALNDDYSGIGHGAGETVWASLPSVLTVRHVQHYGDMELVEETFSHHLKWLKFLKANWKAGMSKLFYDKLGKDLKGYLGGEGGLGDWLSLLYRDTWLTHHAFYMASARAIAYLAKKVGGDGKEVVQGAAALALADVIKEKINSLYMKFDTFKMKRHWHLTPGPELGLFSRIVPGHKRCTVLKDWIRVAGSGSYNHWPGDEEDLFFHHLNKNDLDEMTQLGRVKWGKGKGKDMFLIMWTHRHNTPEGILGIRYKLKALSDMGFHNIALSKATGVGCPSFEYMLSHNATTLWETFWRSEILFSRNHPMLGAVAEWLSSSVAGVSLAPTTVGGEEILFWPRIPTSAAKVQYASATQGTKRGDASIAWEFLDLPEDERLNHSAVVKVHIRMLVPPGSTATLKLPVFDGLTDKGTVVKYAKHLPDLEMAKSNAASECARRRKAGKGFNYNWEYDRHKKEWGKFYNGKAIGTPCTNYLFDTHLSQTHWSQLEPILLGDRDGATEIELALEAGLYDIVIDKWQLTKEIEDMPGNGSYTGDLGPSCSDPVTFSWDVLDATHII